ncbi:ABC transporter permease [Amycolatopsis jejuensis]|uniref:ABC transporter permease n=1 Tax=Amycolatopsis jejuensis TaxID=330084 RepID=UPI0005261A44|nr:ABC transporter permease [Amycolatopsis jejuensis]
MTTTLKAPTGPTAPAGTPARAEPKRRKRVRSRVPHGWVAVVLFLAVWELVPRFVLGEDTRTFLPPVSEDLQALWGLAADGQLADHLLASIGRSAAGFAVAVAVAVPLGLLIGWYRPVARFLQPLLELARNTAALALLPVFTLLLGIGELSKVSLVVYACVWPVLLNTIAGVHSVDPLLVKAARSLGLSSPRLFRKVILPSAVPTVFTGLRMAASYSVLVLIAAEMVGAKAGLGYLINTTQVNFQIPQMYAGIIAVSVLGLVVNQGFVVLERRVSTWRGKEKP